MSAVSLPRLAKDMRALPLDERERLRLKVVRLREQGQTYDTIAAGTGLSRTGVFNICRRYAHEGARGLKEKGRGPTVGDNRVLSACQEVQVQEIIFDKAPDQLKMAFGLWSRQAVRKLIADRYGVALTPQGVGKYLARWRVSLQPPINYQDRMCVAGTPLFDESYRDVEQRAARDGGQIHWGECVTLRPVPASSNSNETAAPRAGRLIFFTVTSRGKLRWIVVKKPGNPNVLIDLMLRIIRDEGGKKIFLNLGNLDKYVSPPVRAWLIQHQKELEVFSYTRFCLC